MSGPTPPYATLDDWIARAATPFSVAVPESLNAAVERVIAALGDSVELLGLGEALHGGRTSSSSAAEGREQRRAR